MNLVEDRWIPVLLRNGESESVSLSEAFAQGTDISDLAVRPHERIALMRLLICIAQAALDGPADHAEWLSCRERIAEKALEYLAAWRHAFELFGDGQRFLQVSNLEPRPGALPDTPITKLDVAMATRHNPTLFDNGAGTTRFFEPARAALALLTFQCFSPSGLIGQALWAGMLTREDNGSDNAPCVSRSTLHSYLRGGDLCATIHLNLLHKAQVEELISWGSPVWECWPQSRNDQGPIKNATETYLGRLLPLSRGIRLQQESDRIVNSALLVYPQKREPAATEALKEGVTGTERTVVSASFERATWRELGAIAVKRSGGGGPLCLQNLTDEEDVELWGGALITGKKPGKLDGTVESVFHVPAAMWTDEGLRTYEAGVALAESQMRRVLGAISAYWREYSRTAGKKPNRDGLKERVACSNRAATSHFWTGVEQGVPDLLGVLDRCGAEAQSWPATLWGKLVERTGLEALNAACPQSTPRQIRAFSEALRVWRLRNDNTRSRAGSKKNG